MTVLPPISKFPQVEQPDAGDELAHLYEDIQCTLRVPWVPFAIRVMALFPDFVPAAWQMLKATDRDAVRRTGRRPGA